MPQRDTPDPPTRVDNTLDKHKGPPQATTRLAHCPRPQDQPALPASQPCSWQAGSALFLHSSAKDFKDRRVAGKPSAPTFGDPEDTTAATRHAFSWERGPQTQRDTQRGALPIVGTET